MLQLAQAATPVGAVTRLRGSATITRADGSRVEAETGTPIFQNDRIVSGADSGLGITFDDDSTFAIGANAQVDIDSYVYDPQGASGMVVNMAQGAFSFVSGQIAKSGDDTMRIITPTATIGVRGTSGAGDEDEVALLEDSSGELGELSVTTLGGTVLLTRPNDYTQTADPLAPPGIPEIRAIEFFQAAFGDALGQLPTLIPANQNLQSGPGTGGEPANEQESGPGDDTGNEEGDVPDGGGEEDTGAVEGDEDTALLEEGLGDQALDFDAEADGEPDDIAEGGDETGDIPEDPLFADGEGLDDTGLGEDTTLADDEAAVPETGDVAFDGSTDDSFFGDYQTLEETGLGEDTALDGSGTGDETDGTTDPQTATTALDGSSTQDGFDTTTPDTDSSFSLNDGFETVVYGTNDGTSATTGPTNTTLTQTLDSFDGTFDGTGTTGTDDGTEDPILLTTDGTDTTDTTTTTTDTTLDGSLDGTTDTSTTVGGTGIFTANGSINLVSFAADPIVFDAGGITVTAFGVAEASDTFVDSGPFLGQTLVLPNDAKHTVNLTGIEVLDITTSFAPVINVSGGGSLTINATDAGGAGDTSAGGIFGDAANDSVTLGGPVTAIDTFSINLGGGIDSFTLGTGGLNIISFANTETITYTGGGGLSASVDASVGTTITFNNLTNTGNALTLTGASNSVTVNGFVNSITATGGNDVVVFNGTTPTNNFNFLGGFDTLNLSNQPGISVAFANIEQVIGSPGSDSLTALTNFAPGSGAIVNGGNGIDTLNLAAGVNAVSVQNVETILGPGGVADDLTLTAGIPSNTLIDLGLATDNDRVILGPGGNTVTIQDAQQVNGGTGSDTVFFSNPTVQSFIFLDGGNDQLEIFSSLGVSGLAAGSQIDGGAGTDQLLLNEGTQSYSIGLSAVESLVGGTGGQAVTLTGAVNGLTVDLGTDAGDALTLANAANVLTVASISTLQGGTSNDQVLFTGNGAVSVDLGAGTTDTVNVNSASSNFTNMSNVEFFSDLGGNTFVRLGTQLTGAQAFDGGAGTDQLVLGTFVTNAATIVNFETITGTSGFTETLTLQTPVAGTTISLGAGTDSDTVNLSTGGDVATIIETANVFANDGNDTVFYDNTTALFGINMGAGDDLLTFLSPNVSSGVFLEGGLGNDVLQYAPGSTVTQGISGFETVLGTAGVADNISLINSVTAFFNLGAIGDGDALTLDTGTNIISFTDIGSVIGGGGTDDFTLVGTQVNFVDMGGGFGEIFTATGSSATIGQMLGVRTYNGSIGTDNVTLGSALFSGNIYNGNTGTDTLTLAPNSANIAQISSFEFILGAAGNETLTQEAGSSGATFTMGGGSDTVTLIAGNVDILRYTAISDAGIAAEQINGFEAGTGASSVDKIDLAAFGLIGFAVDTTHNATNPTAVFDDVNQFLFLDIDADGTEDMRINMPGVVAADIDATDFIV